MPAQAPTFSVQQDQEANSSSAYSEGLYYDSGYHYQAQHGGHDNRNHNSYYTGYATTTMPPNGQGGELDVVQGQHGIDSPAGGQRTTPEPGSDGGGGNAGGRPDSNHSAKNKNKNKHGK